MAAVTHLGSATSSANGTSYATASLTPAAGDLLVVIVAAPGTQATAPTMVESAGGGTYTFIGRAIKATSADALYYFVRDTLCENATARTFTFDCTQDAATGCCIAVAKATGMFRAGLEAIRQSDPTDNAAAGGTPATVFPAVALTGNACIAAMSNAANPATLTAPASFTELFDGGSATPANGLEYAGRDSGHTSATITWGSTSATAFCAFSVELDASARAVPPSLAVAPRIA
ncbi:MAG: hypothetical protein M3540_11505 [Actinomycetota bacterium]|nr:hypothetical protein [Actinomycetota bacterium]